MRAPRQMHMTVAFRKKNRKFLMFIAAFLMVLGGNAAVGTAMATAPGQALGTTYSFDIPAQRLNDALQALALASRHRLLCSAELVDGKSSSALKGEFTTEQAVQQLLAGTGLVYEVSDGLVLIRSASEGITSSTTLLNGRFTLEESAGARASEKGGDSLQLAQNSQSGSARSDSSNSSGKNTASDEEDKDKNNRGALQEIIVTAQKRKERLQDVPVPVTSIGADALVAANQLRLQDYYTLLPGLAMTPSAARGGSHLAIRGITTGTYTARTVGFTVDEVPYGSASSIAHALVAPDIDPSDLARIEVLRGPQGTLYGASSIGGLLNFVTVEPSMNEHSGRVEVGVNSVQDAADTGYSVRAAVNVPLGDSIAIRASGFTRRDPGYVDNVQTGKSDVNQVNDSGGRISALWRPSDEFSLSLGAMIQKPEGDGASYVQPALGELQQSALRGTGTYDNSIEVYSAKLDASVGAVALKSISGYTVAKSQNVFEVPTLAPFAQLLFGVSGAASPERYDTEVYTQEIRLSGLMRDKIEWLLGGYYAHENSRYTGGALAIDPATGRAAGSLVSYDVPYTFTEYSAFGGLTFHATNRFEIQLGARQARNSQNSTQISAGPFATPRQVGSASSDSLTYLLTPKFTVSRDLMVYARLASGYRPGSFNYRLAGVPSNAPPSYQPDKTYNYELGAKGTLFGALVFDASVYYIDWKDIQLFVTPPAVLSGYTDNVGGAKSQGVELSVEARPLSGLTVSAWVSWNEAVLTTPFQDQSRTKGVAGDRLPFSSRFSGNLSINEQFPLGGATGFVGGTLSYVGARPEDFGPASLPRRDFPGYVRTDLHAGVTISSWTLNLFVNNLADRRGTLLGNPVNFDSILYIQPRTVGMSVSKQF